MSSKVFYYHYMYGQSNLSGGFTVAYKINDSQDVIKYGLSYCSPKDFFNRKIGRELAEKRLNEGPNKLNGLITSREFYIMARRLLETAYGHNLFLIDMMNVEEEGILFSSFKIPFISVILGEILNDDLEFYKEKYNIKQNFSESFIQHLNDRTGLWNKGGMTIIGKRTEDPKILKLGFSICSAKDTFSRKIGRELAEKHLCDKNSRFKINVGFEEFLSYVLQFDNFLSAFNMKFIGSLSFEDFKLEVIKDVITYCKFVSFMKDCPLKSYAQNLLN